MSLIVPGPTTGCFKACSRHKIENLPLPVAGGLTPTRPPQNGAGQFPSTPLKHDQRPVRDATM